jgi:hypothetical protein
MLLVAGARVSTPQATKTCCGVMVAGDVLLWLAGAAPLSILACVEARGRGSAWP